MLYCYTFTQLTVGIYGDIYFMLLPYPANRSTICTLNLTAQPQHLRPQRWPCVADKCHTFSLSPDQPVATQTLSMAVSSCCGSHSCGLTFRAHCCPVHSKVPGMPYTKTSISHAWELGADHALSLDSSPRVEHQSRLLPKGGASA